MVAGHAAVGCASTAAGGGSCASGALAAGFSGAAGPVFNDVDWRGATLASAAIGGTASVLGGGKFANGAETGAFGYLFNNAAGALAVKGALSLAGIEAGIGGVLSAIVQGPAIALSIIFYPTTPGMDDCSQGGCADSLAAVIAGPYTEPVIVGDSKGNNIPLGPGQTLEGSPDGDYVQVKNPDGTDTGVRGDYGGHPGQRDPAAQGPHANIPGVTTPDGNPHLPVHQ